jgi:hypothetical protein
MEQFAFLSLLKQQRSPAKAGLLLGFLTNRSEFS